MDQHRARMRVPLLSRTPRTRLPCGAKQTRERVRRNRPNFGRTPPKLSRFRTNVGRNWRNSQARSNIGRTQTIIRWIWSVRANLAEFGLTLHRAPIPGPGRCQPTAPQIWPSLARLRTISADCSTQCPPNSARNRPSLQNRGKRDQLAWPRPPLDEGHSRALGVPISTNTDATGRAPCEESESFVPCGGWRGPGSRGRGVWCEKGVFWSWTPFLRKPNGYSPMWDRVSRHTNVWRCHMCPCFAIFPKKHPTLKSNRLELLSGIPVFANLHVKTLVSGETRRPVEPRVGTFPRNVTTFGKPLGSHIVANVHHVRQFPRQLMMFEPPPPPTGQASLLLSMF